MNKLLAAGFTRLKKDKVFLILMSFMLLFGLGIAVWSVFKQKQTGYTIPIDKIFFICAGIIGMLSAIFSSLFIGSEYHDGAIRNKLVIGHSRSCIYLANLILSSAASLMMSFVYMAAVAAIDLPLIGGFEMGKAQLFTAIAMIVALNLAVSSLLTLLAMTNQSKAAVAVISMVVFVALMFSSIVMQSRLNEPETYSEMVYLTSSGQIVEGAEEANPNYIGGNVRKAVIFLMDFMPSGQAVMIVTETWTAPVRMIISSLSISLFGILVGLPIFRKKDIK